VRRDLVASLRLRCVSRFKSYLPKLAGFACPARPGSDPPTRGGSEQASRSRGLKWEVSVSGVG
jgi:hypothetical protein